MSAHRKKILQALLLIALLVVGCLCAWLLFWSGGNDQTRSSDPAEGPASVGGKPARAQPVDDGGRLVTRPFGEGPERRLAPTGSGFPVRAVLAENGDPVVGAEIRFIDTSDLESWQHFWEEARRGSADLWLRQEGTVHGAGAHGWTLVPSFRRSAILVAAKGNLRSTTRWYERRIPEQVDEGLILELRPVDPFDVRVVDHAGRAVTGMPVGVMHQTQTRRHFSNVQRTGPDGVVRFYRTPASGSREAGGDQWIAAAIPAMAPATIPYPRGKLGEDPLTLTLPPTGEFLVYVRDAMGQLYQKTAWVDIVVEQRPSRAGQILGVRSMTQFTDNGVARFSHVGVGEHFAVMARDKDDLHKLARASFAGPTAAGQELAVSIQLGARRPTIEGRLIHGDGTPCIRSHIVWRPHYVSRDEASPDDEDTWGIRREFMTDDAGLFCAPLDVSLLSQSKVTFHFLLWSADRGNVGPGGPGISILLERIQEGSNPLGELALEPAELLVSGRVVDREGSPVPGAALTLELAPEVGPQLFRPTDEEGRFAVRAHDVSGTFFLTAEKKGHVPARSSALEPGATDVILTLKPGGVLQGSVLLDEGIPPALILVELANEPASGSRTDPIEARLDASYRFEFTGLQPGPRTLCLRLRLPGSRVVRTLERISVRAGELTADSRLRPIDLRGGIPVAILTFLDEGGQRIRTLPGVQAVDSDGEIVDVFREPGTAVFAGKLPTALRVQIPGYREHVQGNADGILSRRVTLRRAQPFSARLQMPAIEELTDRNIRVRVGLEMVGSAFDEHRDKFFFTGKTALLDDVGSCNLQVPEPGIYSLTLRARRYKVDDATWSGEREFTPMRPARIDLRKNPGGETVAVILEIGELRKFLQSLRN